MKKILVLTYYWPPSGGSGVQRWMYFCKYLSDFGYTPIVLTVNEKHASYKSLDHSFLEMVQDIETHRTKTIEPLKIYSLITTGDKTKGIPHGDIHKERKGLLNRLSIYIRGNFFIPDARVGWNRFAIKKARQIISENSIDTIITTGPPHSTHLIGLQLKKEFRVNWLADFRDPWTEIFYNKDFNRTTRATKKDALLEKEVLNTADMVLTIGFKLKELLQRKVVDKDKVHFIYNGYDSFAMDEIEAEKHSYFKITYIGVLMSNRPYKCFIEAMKKFLASTRRPDIRFAFAGNIQEEILDEIRHELPSIDMDVYGYVNHKQALKLMKESQLLLNFLPDMKESEILISGKQIEYIASGNPILSVGNTKGEAAIILDDVPNARIFDKEEVEEIFQFIRSIYEKWINGEPIYSSPDRESIKSKSRYETTRQLAKLLASL